MFKRSIIENPKIYTLASMIIGYALLDDLSANEQNAIGNWLMTIGQILEANSAVQQAIEDKVQGNTININGKNFKQHNDPYMHNPPLTPEQSNDNDLDKLKQVIKTMQDKINELSKKL